MGFVGQIDFRSPLPLYEAEKSGTSSLRQASSNCLSARDIRSDD